MHCTQSPEVEASPISAYFTTIPDSDGNVFALSVLLFSAPATHLRWFFLGSSIPAQDCMSGVPGPCKTGETSIAR